MFGSYMRLNTDHIYALIRTIMIVFPITLSIVLLWAWHINDNANRCLEVQKSVYAKHPVGSLIIFKPTGEKVRVSSYICSGEIVVIFPDGLIMAINLEHIIEEK